MVVSMKQLTKPEPDKLVDPPLSGASTGSGSVNAGSGTVSLAAMGLPVVGSGVIHFIVGEGVMGTSAADVGALVEVSSNPPTEVGADDDVLTSVETEGAADVASSVALAVLGADDVPAETGEAVGTLAGQHVSPTSSCMVVHVSLDSSVFTASTNRSPHVFPTPIPTVSSTVMPSTHRDMDFQP